jgi:rSAM/selenodomain-associated transferase 1
MRDVEDLEGVRRGRETENGPLDRGDVIVLQTEVGEKCEERHVESPLVPDPRDRHLLLFTKPAREGRVKTRLIGDLTPAQAAALHAAFLDDLLDRVETGRFTLTLAWALDLDDDVPEGPFPGLRQRGGDLGERLYTALAAAAEGGASVAALGSDHPTLPVAFIHRAFELLEDATDATDAVDVVLGPAEDGGYYLIALRAAAVSRRLFEEVVWSTDQVFPVTLERCRELGLRVALLPTASDVDTPEDLRRLAATLAADPGDALGCPRTRALLRAWGRLGAGLPEENE